MAGFAVEPESLRAHARNLDVLRERFSAVQAASAHIARDDAAYGRLCGWIAAVLEARHVRQDDLIAYVEENLTVVAEELRRTADAYDAVDAGAADVTRSAARGLDR